MARRLAVLLRPRRPVLAGDAGARPLRRASVTRYETQHRHDTVSVRVPDERFTAVDMRRARTPARTTTELPRRTRQNGMAFAAGRRSVPGVPGHGGSELLTGDPGRLGLGDAAVVQLLRFRGESRSEARGIGRWSTRISAAVESVFAAGCAGVLGRHVTESSSPPCGWQTIHPDSCLRRVGSQRLLRSSGRMSQRRLRRLAAAP